MQEIRRVALLSQAKKNVADIIAKAIEHKSHEGALVMVKTLFGTNGAGQDPQLFGYASDVDADQRAEIARMRTLLAAPPNESPPR